MMVRHLAFFGSVIFSLLALAEAISWAIRVYENWQTIWLILRIVTGPVSVYLFFWLTNKCIDIAAGVTRNAKEDTTP